MKRLLTLFLLGFFSQALAFSSKDIRPLTILGQKVYWVKESGIPMLDISISFDAGSRLDGKHYGLAALTTHLMAKGTVKSNETKINHRFQDVGAIFSSDTDQDRSQFNLRTLTKPEYMQKAINTFVEVLSLPNFPKKIISREKTIWEQGLKLKHADPSWVGTNTMLKSLYNGMGYNHSSDGTISTINKINRSDIKNFYNKYYVRNNAYLVLVGDINQVQAKKISQAILSALKKRPISTNKTKDYVSQYGLKRVAFPSPQTQVIIAARGIKPNDPDRFPLSVGNVILGGFASSTLNNVLREKNGLVYSVFSQFNRWAFGGPFVISFKTRNKESRKALDLARTTLEQFITKGPSKDKLNLAKTYILGTYPFLFSTNASILNTVSNWFFYHLPEDFFDVYKKKVQAVTLNDIKTAFQRHIHTNKMTTVLVGKDLKDIKL